MRLTMTRYPLAELYVSRLQTMILVESNARINLQARNRGYEKGGPPKGWSMVLITVLGGWEKPLPRGHSLIIEKETLKGGLRC
jgi:hypothetical protein